MKPKREIHLCLVLLISFLLLNTITYGFTMEEVLEEELIDVDRPPEIKDEKPIIEETPDTNKSISKKTPQSSVDKDTSLKKLEKKTKNVFADYWYLIAGAAILGLILFLIYKRNKRKSSTNFESYQKPYGYKRV